MSDNHRRYRSIRTALAQMYLKEPRGYKAKQLNVLAALISGIVGSCKTNYPQIASKVPDHTKVESRVKRFSRYINEVEEAQIHLMPFAAELLTNLANFTLVLIMDGQPLALPLSSWDALSAAPPYDTPAPVYQVRRARITLDQLERFANAESIEVELLADGGVTLSYELRDGAWSDWRAFVTGVEP